MFTKHYGGKVIDSRVGVGKYIGFTYKASNNW